MAAQCANPLLAEWLKEWADVAKERASKGATTYNRAYESMLSCPVEFSHPSDALQLHGLGPKLCEKLTERLTRYNEAHGLPPPRRSKGTKRVSMVEQEALQPDSAPKRRKTHKPYVPGLRSGPYALVLGLATVGEGSGRGLGKNQLIEVAQEHCESSFTAPSQVGGFYTAWNSMKTLMNKSLVEERGRPIKKYYLTEEGWDLAKRIQGTTQEPVVGNTLATNHATQETILISSAEPSTSRPKNPRNSRPQTLGTQPVTQSSKPFLPSDVITLSDDEEIGVSDVDTFVNLPGPQGNANSTRPNRNLSPFDDLDEYEPTERATQVDDHQTIPLFTPIILRPGSFTVEIVIDNREVRSIEDRTYIQDELLRRGIKPIIKALDLGDVIWIAKVTQPPFPSESAPNANTEIMLDYILERKRLDDLLHSIRDGRFAEQKFRLRKSGVPNVTYLIEDCPLGPNETIQSASSIETAIASTQLDDKFFVKRTAKLDDTLRYLAKMTELLRKTYEGKPLTVIPSEVVTAENYNALMKSKPTPNQRSTQPGNNYHIDLTLFSTLASKSESLTLRDVFLKMLMCTRGVSAEKALEIQARWPTPRAFVEAYERQNSLSGDMGEKAKKELVAGALAGLIGRKKVNNALSGKIAEIWGLS